MSVLVDTGACVVPGDVLFSERVGAGAAGPVDGVLAGSGTYERVVDSATAGAIERHVVALRLGIAQWDGAMVSVYVPRGAQAGDDSAAAPLASSTALPQAATASAAVFGPRPGDTVHLRITRLSRLSAAGDIIAVGGVWCSGSATLSRLEAFRGLVRVEDIRPFKPSRGQLQPPPPAEAFQPGDVVLAEVLSQSDARQYQLSTVAAHCGVVEGFVRAGAVGSEAVRRLEHIPGRRDAMVCAADGSVHHRWTPLVDA